MFLSRLVSMAKCEIRLYRFLVIYCIFIYFPSYRLNTVYISICIEDLLKIWFIVVTKSKLFSVIILYENISTALQTIRIFNGREVHTENSVTRVTVLHHEACRVTEFSIRSRQPLQILFLAISSLDNCI